MYHVITLPVESCKYTPLSPYNPSVGVSLVKNRFIFFPYLVAHCGAHDEHQGHPREEAWPTQPPPPKPPRTRSSRGGNPSAGRRAARRLVSALAGDE